MSIDVERLYGLLPAIYRVRDAEAEGARKESLKALLTVIAEQMAVLEEDLEQRYDDHFIETCADWVVPYIGDLIGHRPLHGVAPAVSSPRAEVARTLGHRRRKGTAAMLEQLARDVSGWNSAVVEYFLRLATTQYMNHVRPNHAYAPALSKWEPLERINSPFDTVAHTADLRHISSGGGRYNIPNVGVFLWRLGAYSLTDVPAFQVDARRYLFNPLGQNTWLFTRPETETDVSHLATPLNAPLPISRRVLYERPADYYGEGKSVLVKVVRDEAIGPVAAELAEIEVCNLSDVTGGGWAPAPSGKVAIDPVLGRLSLPDGPAPIRVEVTFHYGFSGDVGGGEYARAGSFGEPVDDIEIVRVPDERADLTAALAPPRFRNRLVEIGTSGRFAAPGIIDAPTGRSIDIRAADRRRPLMEIAAGQELLITGGDGSSVTLNGLLIRGGTLRVPAKVAGGESNRLRRLRLRHCTLVPGSATLVVESPDISVEIERCIAGSLRVVTEAEVRVVDSIVDAAGEERVAFAAPGDVDPGAALDIRNSTVIGRVHTVHLQYASNTIFAARADGAAWAVRSERKQQACVRFSYVPWPSTVPRRYRCVPRDQGEAVTVIPRFRSMRYGDPGYGQLSLGASDAIRSGADDRGEMGTFHYLCVPQRESNVRARVDEYLRFGLEAGVLFASDGVCRRGVEA